MTARPSVRRTRRGAAGALLVIAVAAAAGCGTSTDTAEPAPSSEPAPAVCAATPDPTTGADRCDAEAVLAAAVGALFSYDPAGGTGRGPNFTAAGTLLDPAWVRSLGVSYSALVPVTGNTWEQWKADGATVTAAAEVTTDDHPADTATRVARVVAVTQTITGGEALAPLPVYATATRPDPSSGWAVSGVSVR